jgi:hypothetical protein
MSWVVRTRVLQGRGFRKTERPRCSTSFSLETSRWLMGDFTRKPPSSQEDGLADRVDEGVAE